LFTDLKSRTAKLFNNSAFAIASLIVLKTIFQIVIVKSGLRWLSADDYCRTVISYEWLHDPKIYSGVWLSLHFWINGLFIAVFKDLTLAPIMANTLFSVLTLIYFYIIIQKIFDRTTAYLSGFLYCVFPFQVWLSTSGMPESIFFFFVTAGFYYFLKWYDNFREEGFTRKAVIYLLVSSTLLNISNLLRYEGWLFSITLVILTIILSYKKVRFNSLLFINFGISFISLLSAFWWLYMNFLDHNDAFFFIKETTKIFENLNNAGFWQRFVQYPFFVLYIAPLTTLLGLRKIYLTFRNKRSGFKGSFSMLRIYLLFNVIELTLLMLTGILGSGGTNLISRYIVLNSIMFFPFAVWQLLDFRKYISVVSLAALIVINIVWNFYYQQAYRDDTYEVADLTKRLIQHDYFDKNEKIYFEMTEGYFDLYPLQVISNSPNMFNSDTIPPVFPPTEPGKKISQKKRNEEQLKLNILELRKFLEKRRIKLFIARSDLLIDKLQKLSSKSEQIGDYRIFYLSDKKIKYHKGNSADVGLQETTASERSFPPNTISFDKKLILKDFRIDNTNFGLNPQTITLIWQIADMSILDSLSYGKDDFGRFKVKLALTSPDNDSTAYDTYANVFSERNVEEFFETEEIKNILILKPFAMLNYSRKIKLSPFESGLYNLRLSIIDESQSEELEIYKGDSLYVDKRDTDSETITDTTKAEYKIRQAKLKKYRDTYLRRPYYPLGKIIAMFPNANYNEIIKKSKDVSLILFKNGVMLPFLQRYQGDNFLNVVFNYF
jgi:4-amino-4-deoxy-L-arabinose transferase-like glycosyltransferase